MKQIGLINTKKHENPILSFLCGKGQGERFFRMKIRYFIFLALCLMYGCSEQEKGAFLSVNGERFVDDRGRTVILNGINHVTKIPENRFLNNNDEALFRQFREWGFNCIRFGIFWDALEPEPGQFDEEYLQEIDRRVKWAEENGLWLILDMHQDLYSRKFGNGAPLWATLDEGAPHITGHVWSDAYLMSPALQKAFDNFWDNAPAPDGTGVQDHYVAAWKTLAKRYANATSVIGFDLMNEPFMGAACVDVVTKLLEGYAQIMFLRTRKIPTKEELLDMWNDENKRMMFFDTLNDKDTFSHILQYAGDAVRTFEEGRLSAFYQKLRDSIREVDTHHILFLEHNFFCNLGIKSAFRIPEDRNGKPDALCAYAPHGYDLVTDTKYSTAQGFNRLDVIFDRIFQTGKEKKMPVLVGEWGAFYAGNGEYLEPAAHITRLLEQALSGQTYWAYWEDIEKQDYFYPALSRIYPAKTNGNLLHYRNDYQSKQFVCQWEETNAASPTLIYLPDMTCLEMQPIQLTPESAIKQLPLEKSNSGYIEIQSVGKKRTIVIPFQ
jgi:endoglycosylceramidase